MLRLTDVDTATGKPLRLDMERHIWLLTLPHSIRSLLDGAENMKMNELVSKAQALAIVSHASKKNNIPSRPVLACELAQNKNPVVPEEHLKGSRPSVGL